MGSACPGADAVLRAGEVDEVDLLPEWVPRGGLPEQTLHRRQIVFPINNLRGKPGLTGTPYSGSPANTQP